MKIRYVGPHAAVDLALPDGDWLTGIEQGALIQVDDEHGQALLEQSDNWKAEKGDEKKRKADEGGEG